MSTIGYGKALSCTDDLHLGRTVTGAELVVEAIYRRLTTRRGGLLGCPNYGLDVRELLAEEHTPATLAAIPARLRGEIVKDDRVEASSLQIAVETTGNGASLAATISIVGFTTDGEEFELVLAVTADNVEKLKRAA